MVSSDKFLIVQARLHWRCPNGSLLYSVSILSYWDIWSYHILGRFPETTRFKTTNAMASSRWLYCDSSCNCWIYFNSIYKAVVCPIWNASNMYCSGNCFIHNWLMFIQTYWTAGEPSYNYIESFCSLPDDNPLPQTHSLRFSLSHCQPRNLMIVISIHIFAFNRVFRKYNDFTNVHEFC